MTLDKFAVINQKDAVINQKGINWKLRCALILSSLLSSVVEKRKKEKTWLSYQIKTN